jgi:hypothetical protein
MIQLIAIQKGNDYDVSVRGVPRRAQINVTVQDCWVGGTDDYLVTADNDGTATLPTNKFNDHKNVHVTVLLEGQDEPHRLIYSAEQPLGSFVLNDSAGDISPVAPPETEAPELQREQRITDTIAAFDHAAEELS